LFNLKIGLVHLIQAIVLFVIVNYSFKIYLIARFFDKAPNGGFTVSTNLLWNVPIAVVAPVFLLIAAFFHFFVASPFYVRRYEDNIKKGINPMRWVEYSFSSSLMLVALLMMAGIIELSSVVFVFTLNWLMNMLGLMMEKYNQLTEKTKWFPFYLGIVAGLVPWIIGFIYFWVGTSNVADSIPSWAKFGFIMTFVFFNTFAINMFLQYKKVGKWKDYIYGERAYIWLSLTAKSALAWIIVLGTINQVSK
jgi:hypothetical protein